MSAVRWTPRGVGSNGGLPDIRGTGTIEFGPDLSGYVNSRESGMAVVAMFDGHAYLDYRDFEPNYVQVKVAAHDKETLYRLERLVRANDNFLTPEIVQEALKLEPSEEVLAERERCAELAAEFIHRRLYQADFPVCSYHSRDIKDLLLLDPAEGTPRDQADVHPTTFPPETDNLVLRFRPDWCKKVEVIRRQHDLGGTSYETLAWIDYDQIEEHYPNTRFLYANEGVEAKTVKETEDE